MGDRWAGFARAAAVRKWGWPLHSDEDTIAAHSELRVALDATVPRVARYISAGLDRSFLNTLAIMCGIAGFQGAFDPALLHEMNAAIAHRGPDGSGVFSVTEDGVTTGLAQRRLAIIDLSQAGRQPL